VTYREWPSDDKVSKLRDEGRVPLSPFASQVVVLGVLLLLLPVIGNLLVSSVEAYLLQISNDQDPFSAVQYLGLELIFIISITLLVFCFLIVLLTLLQTRFLFRTSRIAFSPAKIFVKRRDLSALMILLRIGGVLIAVGFMLLSFYLFVPEILRGLYLQDTEILEWAYELYQDALLYVIILLIMIGAMSYGLSKFLFLWTHRMTREEVLEERRQHG